MRDLIWTNLLDAGRLLTRILRAANAFPRHVAWMACICMAVPAMLTSLKTLGQALGVNPLEELIRGSGRWALIWLLVALAIAPLRSALVACARLGHWSYGRRMSDWNWFIRLRRQAGLACFSYAVIHLVLYVSLDIDCHWEELARDVSDKPYIGMGIAALLLLTPLAVTSTDAWMRRLERNWKRLHMLVYPAAVFSIAHFLLLSKPGIFDPFGYAMVLAGLLVYRLAEHCLHEAISHERIDGSVPERALEQEISITP